MDTCASAGCTIPQISAIESNLQSEMSMAQAAGINRILIYLGGPWNANTTLGGTDGRMISVDTINSWIISNAPTYGVGVIDVRCSIGQFRLGGSAGNCWDFQSGYVKNDGLGIHPSVSANLVIGSVIYGLVPWIPSTVTFLPTAVSFPNQTVNTTSSAQAITVTN